MINKKSILSSIKTLTAATVAATLIYSATLKGVSSIEYRKLPKEQQIVVDTLRAGDIKESAIRSDMMAFNYVISNLNKIEEVIKKEEYEYARNLIIKTENALKTIRHFDIKELTSRLSKLNQDLKEAK